MRVEICIIDMHYVLYFACTCCSLLYKRKEKEEMMLC